MTEEIGWTPDEVAVKRSAVESKVADIIEDESLHVIDEMSNTDGSDSFKAAKMRKLRGDLRLDTTPAEQDALTRNNEIVTWLIVGVCVALSVGGFLLVTAPVFL
ncbi:MAG: hypothetical protein VX627_03845 [Candidatus Thermoplasmatota archaeon]|nr:hypothetical protein [Candidatus Thermoplasmatota archaeon]